MLKVERGIELWLATQPEYRMGYQKVIAKLNSGGVERGIVVNSQIFLKTDEYPPLMWKNWDSIVVEAQKSSLFVVAVELIQREPETLKGVRQVGLDKETFRVLASKPKRRNFSGDRSAELLEGQDAAKAASAAAEHAIKTLTLDGEIFKRFSAYVNDRRITAGWGLSSGSFATTAEDADANVKTGSQAVSRYALPNSKPASNVFTIKPGKDAALKRGTAQPAYDQTGGGVEVIFVNGLPDGTVSGPVTIPD